MTSGWTVLCHEDTILAVELPAEVPAVGALWALVAGRASSGQILDEIIKPGISAAPSFALVTGAKRQSLSILVRGSAILWVAGPTDVREINARSVSSWVEQVVDASNGFAMGSTLADSGVPALPLRSGIVCAQSLRTVDFNRAASAETGSAAPVDGDADVPGERVPAQTRIPDPPAASPATRDLEATLASQTVSAPPEPTAQPVVVAHGVSEAPGYDHLFGETVFRKVEDAAVRDEPDSEGVSQPPVVLPDETDVGLVGDHDGHTVMVSDIAALRAKRKAERTGSRSVEPDVPKIYIELSTGGREVLDQPLVIGRAPSASRVPGGKVPRLVSMNTPNQDISRTHAQITYEGGTVVVTDLHSSNGTMVILPGKPALKLHPGEPAAVIVGTIIDLGDGATLTVREQL